MSLSDHQVHLTRPDRQYHAAGRPVTTELEMFVRQSGTKLPFSYSFLSESEQQPLVSLPYATVCWSEPISVVFLSVTCCL